jgi:hypothetical protein
MSAAIERAGEAAMSRIITRLHPASVGLAVATLLIFSLAGADLASAAQPRLQVAALADTTVVPGGTIIYHVEIQNLGADTDGSPIALRVQLPPGVTATSTLVSTLGEETHLDCGSGTGSVVECASTGFIPATREKKLEIDAAVDPAATGDLVATLTVSGGGSPQPYGTAVGTRVSASTPPFGLQSLDAQISDAAGQPLTQAGAFPSSMTTSVLLNTAAGGTPGLGDMRAPQAAKDIVVDLPPGFAGSVWRLPQCTDAQLAATFEFAPKPACPAGSQVGMVRVVQSAPASADDGVKLVTDWPLYTVQPPPGDPAQLGFNVLGTVVKLDARLRGDSDYGLSVDSRQISEALSLVGATVTVWGVPADPSHDAERYCPNDAEPPPVGAACASEAPRVPILRNPTSCSAGMSMTAHIDSWADPGSTDAAGDPSLGESAWKSASFVTHEPPGFPHPPSEWGPQIGVTGCANVPFTPEIAVTPLSHAPDTPTGLDVKLQIPQDAWDSPNAIDQADLRKSIVTLPEGVVINPSAASGIAACTPAEIALHSGVQPTCPDASMIGSLKGESPSISQPLEGSVYLASQNDNPFRSLFAMYLVIKAPGVLVKIPGRVDADPATGRLTATFEDLPQQPLSSLELNLFGGPRAPLTTPALCGQGTAESTLEGWNGKTVELSTPYNTDCSPGLGAFTPTFSAGTLNPQANAFTPFTMILRRSDGEQRLSGVQVATPPGLAGIVAGVPECPEAQANAGTCDATSLIGHTTAGAGAGPNPFYIGGQVYFTGPYKGAPFGLSIVTRAVAGPFDLGLVVVRAAISVDPHTAQLTVTSDPLPTILQGIPLDLRTIDVTIDRPNFTFNPTGCRPSAVGANVTSTQGAQAALSSRFQVGECRALAFHPAFAVSTSGHTSKAGGASLHVHVATKEGPSAGSFAIREANIAKVEVALPAVLPSRLTTLQKACTEAQFASDLAGCPVGSFVGTAIAHTPILASPLSGPAILVSHGGQAFPDLVLVLQGEGVHIDLTGHTQIKKGITFSRFQTVPDAPVTSFDLTLPAGPHGALTTDKPGVRNLCAPTKTVTVTRRVTRRINGHSRKVTVKAKKAIAAPLLMPTTMTAQNGAVIHQNTRIAVTGCSKANASTHARNVKKAKRASNGQGGKS